MIWLKNHALDSVFTTYEPYFKAKIGLCEPSFELVPIDYRLNLLVKLLFCWVKAFVASRTSDGRFHLDITFAADTSLQHAKWLILTVMKLCIAVFTFDLISDTHTHSLFKLLYYLLPPKSIERTSAVMPMTHNIKNNISVVVYCFMMQKNNTAVSSCDTTV